MNCRRLFVGCALVAVVGVAAVNTGHAQENPAVDHATRVLDLLEAGKFEEVVAEFNVKMAAAMSVPRLRDTWTTISRQLGARTSIISQRVVRQASGNVTVVNGCQFEKAALNVMLSFDPENKIAGMNITPRMPPAVTSAAPASYLTSLAPGAIDPEEGLKWLRQSAPDAFWKDLDAYRPAQTAAALTIPMLILQGERDYQVTLTDLQGWRDALGGRADVTIRSYPTLNHLFLPGEGESTPSEYDRAGHIPDFVLDDIADWIRRSTTPKLIGLQ